MTGQSAVNNNSNDPFNRYRDSLFFKRFWKKLRRKQRQAVKHFFLANKENKTMRDVAKRLKISVSTLHESLEKAKVLLWEEREKAGRPR